MIGMGGYLVAMMSLIFIEPILADKLNASFGYSSDQVAFFFARFTAACLIANVALLLIPWKHCYDCVMVLGLLFAIAGALFLAPSGILKMQTTPLLLTVGLVCLAIGYEMLLNLAPAYTLEPLYKQFPK